MYKMRTRRPEVWLRCGSYCPYEEEHNQRFLEEFRAGRESSSLNMVSRWDLGHGVGGGAREEERQPREKGPREEDKRGPAKRVHVLNGRVTQK